jgi:DNA polymerase III epsilon subunit family exonuclease
MINNGFTYQLNEKLLENERVFKLAEATVSGLNLTVKFIIQADVYDKKLADGVLKEKVEAIVKSLVPPTFNTNVIFEKTFSTPEYVSRLVLQFIYEKQPLVFNQIKDEPMQVELEYDTVNINIELPSYIYSFFVNQGFSQTLEAFLDTKLIETPCVTLTQNLKQHENKPIKRRKPIEADPLNIVNVTAKELILGVVSKPPRQIKDILNAGQDTQQSVTGKVMRLEKRTTKTGKILFTFRLDDTTAQITVKFFAKDEKQAKTFEESIKDEVSVWVEGPIKRDDYIKENCLFLYRVALAVVDSSSFSNEINYKGENEDYERVFPMPYKEDEKVALAFDLLAADAADESLPEAFKKTYVIFDVETTGLYPSSDKIIEIGAVKMENGEFTQTFSTFVDPQIKIPPDATKINGIRDTDVEGAPTWKDVAPDFYKFTRGATIVAHNAEFDMGFIRHYGKEEFYNFDNEVLDTLALCRKTLKLSKNNLESVCKELNITLTNAHRALNDAVATAKVLKCLLIRKDS